MAWALDVANLGNNQSAGSGTQLVVTTSSAAAAGSWIYLTAGGFGSPTVSTIASSPALTWEIVQQNNNGSVQTALIRAYAPSGLASGSTITVTWSGTINERKVGATSFTGGFANSAIENTATNTGAAAGHSVSPVVVTSGALCIEVASLDTASSSTVDANSVEDQDFVATAVSTAILYHRIAAGTGATAVGGTWASATTWAGAGAAFSTGDAAAASVNTPTFQAIPFMR